MNPGTNTRASIIFDKTCIVSTPDHPASRATTTSVYVSTVSALFKKSIMQHIPWPARTGLEPPDEKGFAASTFIAQH